MKQTYKCKECGIKIIIESKDGFMPQDPILCQKCDPAWKSLLDNKHHNKPTTPAPKE